MGIFDSDDDISYTCNFGKLHIFRIYHKPENFRNLRNAFPCKIFIGYHLI